MLSRSRIKEIDLAAQDALNSLYQEDEIALPINLMALLDRHRLELRSGLFPDPTVAGAYDKDKRVIYITENDPYTRQAFTTAHELGHYFLHKQKKDDIFYRTQLTNLTQEKESQEAEANWFAASLLMPEKSLEHFLTLTKDISELATIFAVSKTALYFRLKNLAQME